MHPNQYSAEQLNAIINPVFIIEDIIWGDASKGFIIRYHGKLRLDSEAAFQQLLERLNPLSITPLFRLEEGRQTIILTSGVVSPKPSDARINLLLFVLTLVSMLFAGALYDYGGPQTEDMGLIVQYTLSHLDKGIPFAVSMLAILLAHEFGHYFMARRHKTQVTLPYYLPFPLSPFGTLGAFINLKEPPKNKRVLLDIGIGGPLAGLLVTLPVLFYGLFTSPLNYLPLSIEASKGLSLEGNSIFYLLSKWIIFGQFIPAPQHYDIPQFLYWVRYYLLGQPLPWGGLDVHLNAVAWAGWAGLLVTALNLIPAGQLDGGHLLYVLVGEKSKRLFIIILFLLFALGFVWTGWWIWAVMIFFFGRTYAEPLDQITPLDPRRRFLAYLGLVIFVLIFTPVPLIIVGA